MTGFFRLALAAAVCAAATTAAIADEPITVRVNMARVLRISAPAATVIIGNPGVADVTIQDPKTLVLTGKTYGQTNLIVLDSAGQPVADTLIEVIQEQADLVTIFNGQARVTYACATDCAPTVMVGDDTGFTNQLVTSLGMVQSAQGGGQ